MIRAIIAQCNSCIRGIGMVDSDPITRQAAQKIKDKIGPILDLHTTRWELCGSFRRQKPMIGDLDFLVVNIRMDKFKEDLIKKFPRFQFWRSGSVIMSGLCKINGKNVQIEFLTVGQDEFGSGLLHCTGSGDFNWGMRACAKTMGFKLNQYGLFKDNIKIASQTEEEIFSALGIVL